MLISGTARAYARSNKIFTNYLIIIIWLCDISILFFFSVTNGFFLYVSLFRYHFADNLIFYAHFRYLFLLGFLVPAYVFVDLYLLLFIA
jgi:hypothetical protein